MSKKISYKPLWKLLIDLDISQSELIKNAKIGKSTFYKLKNNKNVNTDSLIKICETLNCNISDIMTCEEEKRNKNEF
ncbi:XRE family transcriptional regulator [Mammaliicoccus sciuri]|nr:helix-turn-helix transcriptional regulator [Mammaliicoccus sciuri]RIO10549.1 XRE family transcriptional regulator [Mammaliicoccus sciuri]RIO15508.1 XRE family transcriptional regulator [Mammaliicoccus sciuri]